MQRSWNICMVTSLSRTSSKTSSGLPPGPTWMVPIGNVLWAIQWLVRKNSNKLLKWKWSWLHLVFVKISCFKLLRFPFQLLFWTGLLGTGPDCRHEATVRNCIVNCWDQKCHLCNWWPCYCCQLGGATMQIRFLSSFIQWAWLPGDHIITCRVWSGGGIRQISQLRCP